MLNRLALDLFAKEYLCYAPLVIFGRIEACIPAPLDENIWRLKTGGESKIFQVFSNSMYGRQDSITISNRETFALEILSIAKSESAMLDHTGFIAACRIHRSLYQYEWDRKKLLLKQSQDSSNRSVTECLNASTRRVELRRGELLVQSLVNKTENHKKLEIFRRELMHELSRVRSNFDKIIEDLETSARSDKQTERSLLLQSKDYSLRRCEEEFSKHLEEVLRIHQSKDQQLTSYFTDIHSIHKQEINELERSTSGLRAQQQLQVEQIRLLTEENRTVSTPLTELNSRKQKLLEELRLVTSGTMALRNFRQLKKSLEDQLETLSREILGKESYIKQLECNYPTLTLCSPFHLIKCNVIA